MAVRFAVATGNWSNTTTWDSGALPVAGDVIYPNGFTVTIDTDINVDSLNNNVSPVYLPSMPIPLMTGNTQPNGVAFAGQNSSTAYQAFDYNSSTAWASTNLTNCTVGYQFTSGKIIKRYYLFRQSENQRPTSWTFEGSNDGITWSPPLDTVTANTGTTPYLSGILANTTSYIYYRINITAVSSGTVAYVRTLEMTESIGTVYGVNIGGGFTVPNTLSGTRNIIFSGAGICTTTNTTLTIAALSGNIVNINVSSGGYILNQTLQTTNVTSILISGTCIVNFNGDIWGCQVNNAYFTTNQIIANNASTINVFGNLYSCRGHGAYSTSALIGISNASNILNITGNLIGGTYAASVTIIYLSAASTVNVVGNLTADIGACIISNSNSLVNINSGIITVTNQNSQAAIYMTLATSLLTINGSIINKFNVNAILAPKIRFASTSNPYWIFQTTGASDMTLSYGTPATGPYPAEADVRYNTAYGASPTRYGTLRVPLPQYVSQGVLTDNTTGTAYLSATDVWNVLTSNITTAGSIGERLKNASTVQTNGDQLAAYIV